MDREPFGHLAHVAALAAEDREAEERRMRRLRRDGGARAFRFCAQFLVSGRDAAGARLRGRLRESPFADAQAIIEAAERAGRVLLVGHSHSYDAPIARMRALVEEGTLGAPR
ncbi:MAG TPA: hypothetical protein VFP36_05070, partial [Usitatibacter sp.]|nr:hypothetical protein [Usitatibacter sp.]